MDATVTEINKNVFRISSFNSDFGIQFNQFLIKDDEPFLMHTGMRSMFQSALDGVGTVIDPKTLRWIGFSHFESDECGALNDWLSLAPQAQAVCSFVGAMVNVNDFAIRPARPLADNEVLKTGSHHLQFLATPHVPHGWDAGLFYDQTTKTLLCSDLFFQPGDPEPLGGMEILKDVKIAIQEGAHGPLANDVPFTAYTRATLQRLAGLKPEVLAIMHGSSFKGDGAGALLELDLTLSEFLGGEAA